MQKKNYQKELDKLLIKLKKEERVPTLLLHCCCAPCSSYVLEYLSEYFKITVFFYNPNIDPESEYTKRILELQRLIGSMNLKYPVSFIAGQYDSDRFYEMARPYIEEVVTRDCDTKKIAALVKTRIEILPDIREQIDFFEAVPEYDVAMYTHKKMKTDPQKALEVLKELLPILENQGDFSNDALFETLKAFAGEKGYKIGYVMWPIRTAVSGKQNTPGGATEIMEVLGKEESLKRIRAGVEKLSEQA